MYNYLLEIFKNSRKVKRETLMEAVYSIGDFLNENIIIDDTFMKIKTAKFLSEVDKLENERMVKMAKIELNNKEIELLGAISALCIYEINEQWYDDDEIGEYDVAKENMIKTLENICKKIRYDFTREFKTHEIAKIFDENIK